jgi:hypothetical protein
MRRDAALGGSALVVCQHVAGRKRVELRGAHHRRSPDARHRVAQFLAWPHEAFYAGGIDNLVCVALAEGYD